MDLAAVLAFAAVAFTLIVVPGPDWAYVLATGARDRVVIPPVLGLVIGYGIITTVVMLGVGPFLASQPLAMLALTLGGAIYLLSLGVKTLRSSGAVTATGEVAALASSAAGYVGRGIAVSGLNPKSILLYLAVLPQFTVAGQGWPLPLQLGTLGAVYMLITLMVLVPLGYTAGRFLGAGSRASAVTTKLAGVAMLVLGAALIGEKVAHAVL